ncbi:Katanin (p60) [Spironucleus salmonicida]|uniref:Katanin (p60) n=1 Tax=Spironucleus salmonicida TaxID=348837 RepID=V6M291_9EUKA|nr:Katanin (p60) [Spironucleus salmonicida]|eukprot:EST47339.1 Katanin p60 ATPase-containing subunit A1 [Spironucleus salmonicida]
MQNFDLFSATVDKAHQKLLSGQYDMTVQLYLESIQYFEKFKRSLPADQIIEYQQIDDAIREELKYAKDIAAVFKNSNILKTPQKHSTFDSDSEVYDQEPQVRKTPVVRQSQDRVSRHNDIVATPSKWNRNAPQPRDYRPKELSKPSQQASRNITKQPSYEKPWQRNTPAKSSKDDRQAKTDDGLPKNYEGVDIQYVPTIHALMLKETHTSYEDIAGLDDAKKVLTEAIVMPIKMPTFFTGKRKPWKGVLMFGPPGTGKTQIAKAIATEAGCTFFAPTSSTIMNKMVGDSEKVVKALFSIARFHAPSIVFIDEIDALLSSGSGSENDVSKRIRQEFLTQMEGVTSGPFDINTHVVVLGATNHPEKLDEALRRRLEKRVYIPMPEEKTRLQLLQIFTKGENIAPAVDFEAISKRLDGYNGSDISSICSDALMEPLRRLQAKYSFQELASKQDQLQGEMQIMPEDFENAIQKTKPAVAPGDIQKYMEFKRDFAVI